MSTTVTGELFAITIVRHRAKNRICRRPDLDSAPGARSTFEHAPPKHPRVARDLDEAARWLATPP